VNNQTIIDIKNLTKTYRGAKVPAVNNISLSIETGEIFGLLGPNGAGKTTTISVLCGLLKANSGAISIAGMSIESESEIIKQIIGVVPQDIALYPRLNAYENLNFIGRIYGLTNPVLKEQIDIWLNRFGLTENAHRPISVYSGGMKRRINLIAGILHNPKLLFLDEPTVGIDVQSKQVIIEHLTELNKQGMSIIYTSHHINEAADFCSQIAIIDYGTIIAQGKPSELIQNYPDCKNLECVFIHLTGREFRDDIPQN